MIILGLTAFLEGEGKKKHADMQSEWKEPWTCDSAGISSLGALASLALLVQTHIKYDASHLTAEQKYIYTK